MPRVRCSVTRTLLSVRPYRAAMSAVASQYQYRRKNMLRVSSGSVRRNALMSRPVSAASKLSSTLPGAATHSASSSSGAQVCPLPRFCAAARSKRSSARFRVMRPRYGASRAGRLVGMLFQAATKSNHFKELHTYYFHNCIYGDVYNGPRLWQDGQTPTEWLLQNFDASYKVILVGDAAMNPYELREKQYDWRNQRYGPSGLEWLELFKKHFPYLIWLNPEPLPAFQDFWTLTHLQLAKLFPMFDLSAEGLEQGMKRLMVKR